MKNWCWNLASNFWHRFLQRVRGLSADINVRSQGQRSKVKVKCLQNLITSRAHRKTHSYRVTSMSHQQIFSFCTDGHTHTHADRQTDWHTSRQQTLVDTITASHSKVGAQIMTNDNNNCSSYNYNATERCGIIVSKSGEAWPASPRNRRLSGFLREKTGYVGT